MPQKPPLSVDDFGVTEKPSGTFSLADFGIAPAAPQKSVIEMGRERVTSDAPEHEPDTFYGGAFKSLKSDIESARDKVIPALQGIAHPKEKGDFLQLLIPAGGQVGVDAWKGMKTAVVEAAREAPTLKSFPRTLLGNLWRDARETPFLGGREVVRQRAFNKLPLQDQMANLPTSGVTPERMRAGGPLATGHETPIPFNELPLQQQMEQLPARPTPERMRAGGPAASGRETPTPFHEKPLYQQMEDLPASGLTPERMRSGGPPRPVSSHAQAQAESLIAPGDLKRLKAQYPDAVVEKLLKQLADDVKGVRTSISKGTTPAASIQAAAEGSTEYADALKDALTASVKKEGLPVPDALRKLMKSSSMQGLPNEEELAAEIAKRNITGSWKK